MVPGGPESEGLSVGGEWDAFSRGGSRRIGTLGNARLVSDLKETRLNSSQYFVLALFHYFAPLRIGTN